MDGQTGNVENQLQKSPAFVSSVRQFAGKGNLKRKLLKVDMKQFFKFVSHCLHSVRTDRMTTVASRQALQKSEV